MEKRKRIYFFGFFAALRADNFNRVFIPFDLVVVNNIETAEKVPGKIGVAVDKHKHGVESAVFVQMTILVVLTVVACDKCLRRCADIIEEAEPHGIAGIALLRNLEIGLVTEIQFLHIIIF